MLIHPAFAAGRFGFRLFQRGTHRVFQIVERISGLGFLEDISEFLLAFEGMSGGFRERARRVRALLVGSEATFVLVAGTGGESQRQASEFLDRLEAFDVPLSGVLINRVRLWPGDDGPPDGFAGGEPRDPDLAALAKALAAGAPPDFPAEAAARAAVDAATGYAALVRRDARSTRTLRTRARDRGRYWGQVPEFAGDIHDLAGLAHIAYAIFHGGEPSLGEHAER